MFSDGNLLLLNGREIEKLITGREKDVLEVVGRAYLLHAAGVTSLPHSVFLHFPENPSARIIALPGYLGGEFETAGVKWIASFPQNHEIGLDRASATLILNSTATGQPRAIFDGTVISAKRTGASAALAAARLLRRRRIQKASFVGCGIINFETCRFLQIACPEIKAISIFDLRASAAEHFRQQCSVEFPGLECEIVSDIEKALAGFALVSLATNAGTPHIFDINMCARGAVILHISLRDLAPAVILASNNVVDDPDHVCREATSVHLAEKIVGNRGFINCTISETLGDGELSLDPLKPTIVSPFGLGILDLALAATAEKWAKEKGTGVLIDSMAPEPWSARKSETAAA